MSKQKDTTSFIQQASIIHNNKFCYDKTIYTNAKTKIIITCHIHGDISIRPNTHLSGSGCKKCYFDNISNTNSLKFKMQSSIIHNNKFDYSKVEYLNSESKVIITCPIHGDFTQSPSNHLCGKGCVKCQYITISNKFCSNTEEFVRLSNIVHNSKFDYSKTEYFRSKHKVIIICKLHGDFHMLPSNHLKGQGCPHCGQLVTNNKNRKTNTEFITESNIVHNNMFDYSNTEYLGIHSPVIIICKLHGEFQTTASNHIHAKSKCPKCYMSKGELEIENYLKQNNIKFECQKTFPDCTYKSVLRFDFYLPDYNTLIEYDGIQHFKPIAFFGGEKALASNKIRDQIKTEYANVHGIDLIRISDIKLIETKLKKLG